MVRTYGLTHLALTVADTARSLRFYSEVFGMVAVYEQDGFVQAQTPGSRDVLVFEEATGANESRVPGAASGIVHFGFRLLDPADIVAAAEAVERAGGTITSRGDFCPGEPYLFFLDLDGYEVEIWYEQPTPVDPPT